MVAVGLAIAAAATPATAHAGATSVAPAAVTATAQSGCVRVVPNDDGELRHPDDVRLYQIRHSLIGLHRWYEQTLSGFPVVGGWWGWHLGNGVIADDCRVDAGRIDTTVPRLTSADAAQVATSQRPGQVLATSLVAVPRPQISRLAWAVTTLTGATARCSYVDALNGRVLTTTIVSSADRSRKGTAGTARVFDPNPVVALQDETLADDDDAPDAVPSSGYATVRLPRLQREGRTLVGRWAAVINKDRAHSPTATYEYNRHNDYFEQVMAYHAIDAAQAYLDALGFSEVNASSQQVRTDAFAADTSIYVPGVDQILMGAGGVDDAEDPEVTWHEYGHAIEADQVPGWGQRYEARAIGEGFADYFAAAMSVASGSDTATTPAACLMDWDATARTDALPHCVRRVDTDKTWSGTPDGDPHVDGEIWSAALWDLYQQFGDLGTMITLESQFWMTPNVTFGEAAQTTVDIAALFLLAAGRQKVEQVFAARGLLPSP
jgi:Fungalysin metallopeptidase (M36)